ncbi:hypothetical protein [Acidianus manzaensis]|uniref:Thermopsin n=1 Tax=Acidianus manzaensis TaxID=282676 RepID=A0A1W6JWM7_9CREN|nr:hypothetical protein [Acidianus manzaensis]ARM74649.1 hypothetical protein B6F84_00485 [Acidianus manzaensis]
MKIKKAIYFYKFKILALMFLILALPTYIVLPAFSQQSNTNFPAFSEQSNTNQSFITFTDNFTQDNNLNTTMWSDSGPLYEALLASLSSPPNTVISPTLSFNSSGMLISGPNATYTATGLLLNYKLNLPLSLIFSGEGISGPVQPMTLVIANANLTNFLRITLEPNSTNGPYYGVWVSHTGCEFSHIGYNIYPTPCFDVIYTYKVYINSTGYATVELYQSGLLVSNVSGIYVGTQGPFYVVLADLIGLPYAQISDEIGLWTYFSATEGYIPVAPPSYYNLTFTESGLPQGTPWSVTLNGTTKSSTSNEITFTVKQGTYNYMVTPPSGYNANPSSGIITLTSNTTILINFLSTSSTLRAVTFIETGLPQGTKWNVTINDNTFSTSNNEIKICLSSGSYSYYVSDVAINAQSSVSLSNLVPSLCYIPSPQQGTFYFNGSTNKMIYIQFFNGMNVNFQIVVRGNYGQQYIGSLACIYGTNPVELEVNAFYYDTSSGSTIPLNSVVVKLSSYNGNAKLLYGTVLTNFQGIGYDNLSSILPRYNNPIIVPVLVSLGSLTKEVTIVFESYENQVKTFSLCVYNDSQYYNLIFFVNGSSFLSLQNNAPLYISKFAGICSPQTGEFNYPIYYVLIYPKGYTVPVNIFPNDYTNMNPNVILLVNAIIWEAEYANLEYLTELWGLSSPNYNLALNDYNNNWEQKIFIYTTYGENYASIILPIVQSITGLSNLQKDLICLIDVVSEGSESLSIKYGVMVSHDMISILKAFGVIKTPQYNPLCFLQNFYKLNPSQQYQLLSQLMSYAYNIKSPNENVINLGITILEKMAEEFVLEVGVPTIIGGLSATIAETIYASDLVDASLITIFGQSLENELLAGTFLEAFSDALDPFISVTILLIVGSVLIQQIALPAANLMISDNKLENFMLKYAYPIEFFTLSNMKLNGYIANLTDGILLYQNTMFLKSLWGMWYFVTSKLYNGSILNPQQQAEAPELFTDGQNCVSTFYQMYSTYTNSLPSIVTNILSGNDPPPINMSALLSGNKTVIEPPLYNFPVRNVVGIATIGNNTCTKVFYGKYYIIANETGIYGNYPYAVLNKLGNITEIVLFNTSEGNLVIYSNAKVNLIPYSFIFNNESINAFRSEEVENNSLIMLNVVKIGNNSLINEGNSTLTFELSEPSLLEINGTIIHPPYNNITILAPAGKYQYEIINNNTLRQGSVYLASGTHIVIGSHIAITSSQANLERIPLSPWLIIGLIVFAIILIIIVIAILRRNV